MTGEHSKPPRLEEHAWSSASPEIAAYKAVSLLRAFVREGATVDVAMTRSATKFVTPLTFEVLSGRPVTRLVPGAPGNEAPLAAGASRCHSRRTGDRQFPGESGSGHRR